MTYPIDLHIINARNKFDEALNHAHDLGWDLALNKVIEMLEEIETYPTGWDYDDPFKEMARLVRENFGVKKELP